MITKADGSTTAVENLTAGDKVLSKNIPTLVDSDNADTLRAWSNASIDGTASEAEVVSNISSNPGYVWNFNNGLLKTTGGHLHMVKRGSEWIIKYATELQLGDKFMNAAGEEVEITSIVEEEYNGSVFKLNIETDDVYYANGILTHNIK